MTASLGSPERGVVVGAARSAAVAASFRDLGGQRVAWFRIAGGKHHAAVTTR